jgi:EAL domain-containing protein (putative c-di-GMP-specific phosphodiesterase class I)/CheY-like chemotaxis protein
LALQRGGFETIVAGSAAMALEIVDSRAVDVLVSDVGMPGMSGIELVRALRARPRSMTLPILLITGSGHDRSVIEGLEAGADDFLPKPVRLDELVARVQAQLRSRSVWARVLQDELRIRSEVVASLGDLTVAADASEAAARITEAVAAKTEAVFVSVSQITSEGSMVELATFTRTTGLRRGGETFAADLAGYLISRAKDGPWVDEIAGMGMVEPSAALRKAAPDLIASAPLFAGGSLAGLLTIGSVRGSRAAADERRRLLSAAIDYATVFDALAGSSIAGRDVQDAARARLASVLEARAFKIVVQPIVELETERVLGYEALTRFDDGTRPDVRFAEAASLGLGPDFEIASIARAIEVTTALDDGLFLSLNVSPDTVVHGSAAIAELIAPLRRTIVLEVTEHVRIDEYQALREAIRGFGRKVSLAVDDAGAGYASLRHILELEPGFAKLDISLVRGIDADRLRQSLAAGLNHYALLTGCRLIAEGVETRDEARTLQHIGVELAQGYLFGRPVDVADLAG